MKEEDREELMAIRFPHNVNKTEDLASRVVFQKNERFKNKQQVLFGGTKQMQGQQKFTEAFNHISF